MQKKIHLEWAKVYWPQDYEVVDEMKISKEENKKLKETIKDHQLYEEKLEHRIIEFEELLHWE